MSLSIFPDTARIRSSLPAIVLAIGDVTVFVFFAVQGRATHDIPLGAEPVAAVVGIAAPFAAPWFVVAALLGVYRHATIIRPKRAALLTAAAWLTGGPLGLVARSVLLQRSLVLPFALASLGIIGGMLLAWHTAFSLVAARRAGFRQHAG